MGPTQDKIQFLLAHLSQQGISVDLSEYFLIKRLLLSDFESVGQYRKNLCLIAYLDGEEYIVNMARLLEFYQNLKDIAKVLSPDEYASKTLFSSCR